MQKTFNILNSFSDEWKISDNAMNTLLVLYKVITNRWSGIASDWWNYN